MWSHSPHSPFHARPFGSAHRRVLRWLVHLKRQEPDPLPKVTISPTRLHNGTFNARCTIWLPGRRDGIDVFTALLKPIDREHTAWDPLR